MHAVITIQMQIIFNVQYEHVTTGNVNIKSWINWNQHVDFYHTFPSINRCELLLNLNSPESVIVEFSNHQYNKFRVNLGHEIYTSPAD